MIQLMRTKNALLKNGFICEIFENRYEAVEYFSKFIRKDKSVGMGGSITVEELKIYDLLKDNGIKVVWHWKENKDEAFRNAIFTDYYICSANAVTEDGYLYFVDRYGNRISAVSYGHEKVFLFIGRNKLVRDIDSAFERGENIATPLNTRRINMDTLNHKREQKSRYASTVNKNETANLELLLRRNPQSSDIYVFLINEDLGY